MKKTKFLMICEEIEKQRKAPEELWSYEIGKQREEKTAAILQEMKDKRIIRDFLQTDVLSFQNVVEGIDFFVVYIDMIYRICPLSVTGEGWIGEHQDRHPEIPVIAINLVDTSASIKSKIMEAINIKAL